jgi:hypothetical protein
MSNLATMRDGRSLEWPSPGRPGELAAPLDASALYWILRVGVAACFIGHGAFGIITKAAWLPYFAIFGIPEAWAWKLMPMVGTVDVTVGVLTLFQPIRAVILYMTFWGCRRPAFAPSPDKVCGSSSSAPATTASLWPSSSCSVGVGRWLVGSRRGRCPHSPKRGHRPSAGFSGQRPRCS